MIKSHVPHPLDLGLFIHAPPEHRAHVINAASLNAGLRALGVMPRWVTMNPRNTSPALNPWDHLREAGLAELAEVCPEEVVNCAEHIVDQWRPTVEELELVTALAGMRAVYVHYYPPFWAPLVELFRREGTCVALHVQLFHQSPAREFQFDFAAGARDAVLSADRVMVSQEADVSVLEEKLGIERARIHILPKSVPPRALERARAVRRGEIKSKCDALFAASRGNVARLLYLGRLEPIKNIAYFLEKCMPALEKRTKDFEVLVVGTGRDEKRVIEAARGLRNVTVIIASLPYEDVLALIGLADLAVFPSGFDYAPRFPLEALLLGVPCVLGGFHFNQRYWPHAIVVPPAGESTTRLEYSGQTVVYGIPDAEALAAAIDRFIDTGAADHRAQLTALDRESHPVHAARVLLQAFGLDAGVVK